MGTTQTSVWLPNELWKAVQLCAVDEGDTSAVIIRALEEYFARLDRKRGVRGSGKYKTLVASLSLPVADLQLSARALTCLRQLNVRYVYELVEKTPTDLRKMRNFGEKSFREIKDKLAALGLTLDMPLDRSSYAAAVTASLVANIRAEKT